VVTAILEKNHGVLKQGAILVDPNDYGQKIRILFFLESSIQDSLLAPSGSQRVIARRVEYVELTEDQEAKNGGLAPYLNYRPPEKDEENSIREHLKGQKWLNVDVENLVLDYASQNLIPGHLKEVRDRKERIIDKTMIQVDRRLSQAIRHWDERAAELKRLEDSGRVNAKINSKKAQNRANELDLRLKKRIDELKKEKMISALPPLLVGGALVAPLGLVKKLLGQEEDTVDSFGGLDRKGAELAAMNKIMAIERSLGLSWIPEISSIHYSEKFLNK
jgi:hypothetical protein